MPAVVRSPALSPAPPPSVNLSPTRRHHQGVYEQLPLIGRPQVGPAKPLELRLSNCREYSNSIAIPAPSPIDPASTNYCQPDSPSSSPRRGVSPTQTSDSIGANCCPKLRINHLQNQLKTRPSIILILALPSHPNFIASLAKSPSTQAAAGHILCWGGL